MLQVTGEADSQWLLSGTAVMASAAYLSSSLDHHVVGEPGPKLVCDQLGHDVQLVLQVVSGQVVDLHVGGIPHGHIETPDVKPDGLMKQAQQDQSWNCSTKT